VRCRGRWGAKVPWGYNAASLGGPKRADRFQIGPEAAGPRKTAPRLEPEASLEVPSAERFTPYLSAIHD
jgi:hypothetical protein